jgi:hypothetical protein
MSFVLVHGSHEAMQTRPEAVADALLSVIPENPTTLPS